MTTIKQAEEALMDSIQRVAEAARDLSDEADLGIVCVPDGRGSRDGYHVQRDAMKALRAALKDWSNAGDALMRTVRKENAA